MFGCKLVYVSSKDLKQLEDRFPVVHLSRRMRIFPFPSIITVNLIITIIIQQAHSIYESESGPVNVRGGFGRIAKLQVHFTSVR